MSTPTKENSSLDSHPARGNPALEESGAPAAKKGGHKAKIVVAIAILLAIAGGVFGYWCFFLRGTVFSDDARLAGHLVDAAPEIYGRIIDVPVHEGQFVHTGDNIFLLDPSTQKAAIAQSEAALAAARAELIGSQARLDRAINGSRPEEVLAAEAILKRCQSDEELARLELERIGILQGKSAASQDELDRARATLESARQCRENAAQTLAICRQGSRKEDIDAAKAQVEASRSQVQVAQAALDKARSDLDRCVVKAPFDGWVVRRWLDPGAMPLPGQPVVSLFDPATLRVDANIEEKFLNRVAIGDEADISVDAYPDVRLKGRITQILRATNSQFSLIPAEGVSGTFIKVTQRVPIRITVVAPAELPLGPGLSTEVKIRSGSAKASGELARD